MTDNRRVRHPAAAGVSHAAQLTARPTVVVVGGGIAGLSAATALAERGAPSARTTFYSACGSISQSAFGTETGSSKA